MFKIDTVIQLLDKIRSTKHKALFVLVFGLIIVMQGTGGVFAANFFNTNPSANCGDSNIKLVQPYQKGGTSYYCVSGLITDGASSEVSSPVPVSSQKCDANIASYESQFGVLCITNPSKPTVTDLNSPQFAKSDCNGKLQAGAAEGSVDHCGIIDYLQIFINTLSALVGVVIVVMIIIGGIQYSASGDDPQKVQAAKSKITNALLALFVFVFMFAILQFLVPGGIF
jgi:hypothetical protein